MESLESNQGLPLPPERVETPAFVILEQAVLDNIARTIASCGSRDRLMPHVKTHRSTWVTKALIEHGVSSFKCATPAELEMVLKSGASRTLWAYPTLNCAAISRVVKAASKYPDALVLAAVDEREAADLWAEELAKTPAPNLKLLIDLDPGGHRTGAAFGDGTANFAKHLHSLGLLFGWHIYDGHIQDRERAFRARRVSQLAKQFSDFVAPLCQQGLPAYLVAGSSWSFDLWDRNVAAQVSPGSFIYSSAHHQAGLPEQNWQIGAFVLSTVVSVHDGTATLDAGSKSISPDKPVGERFVGGGSIVAMMEEHSIVRSNTLQIGDVVALVPRHACTTAYLFELAHVHTLQGTWETRSQLGATR